MKMIVIELIRELNKYPSDAEVVMDSGDGEEVYNIDDVEGQSEFKYGEVKRVLLK
jgi:hypothetical protein